MDQLVISTETADRLVSSGQVIELQTRDSLAELGLTLTRLDEVGALIVTKHRAGVSDAGVDWLRDLLAQARAGRLGALKFLVVDFAHGNEEATAAGPDFGRLIDEVADLILGAPIVTIASCRAAMAGADLEFALACSVMLSEQRTPFWFGAELDLEASLTTYALLAQKIGFVRAERLLEGGERVDGQQMRSLLLVKETLPDGQGLAGVRQYLQPAARRHNSSYGIYRAHRLATRRPAA